MVIEYTELDSIFQTQCLNQLNWCLSVFSQYRLSVFSDVGDTFCLLRNQDNVTVTLQYINSLHDNIEFTMEEEMGGTLSLLDTEIQRTSIHG